MDTFLVMVCIFVGYLAISWVIEGWGHAPPPYGDDSQWLRDVDIVNTPRGKLFDQS